MKTVLIVLAFVSLLGSALTLERTVPARASSNSAVDPVGAENCADRYNSLLKSAKGALAAGDRNTTIDLLQQAKDLIPKCRALQYGQLPIATTVAL